MLAGFLLKIKDSMILSAIRDGAEYAHGSPIAAIASIYGWLHLFCTLESLRYIRECYRNRGTRSKAHFESHVYCPRPHVDTAVQVRIRHPVQPLFGTPGEIDHDRPDTSVSIHKTRVSYLDHIEMSSKPYSLLGFVFLR